MLLSAAALAAGRSGRRATPLASLAAAAAHLAQQFGSSTPAGAAAAAAAAATAGHQAAAEPALLEIREYTLKPEGMAAFLKLAGETAALRSQLLPFHGMFTCDTGGCLNKVTHFYTYKDLEEREARRAAAAANEQWQAFIAASRAHVAHQESRILNEAGSVYAALGRAGSAAAFRSPQQSVPNTPVYEFRQYQLHPGYSSVPKLLAAFADGLPEKVAADRDGLLVAFGASEVGVLNNVVELWRYPSAAACLRARAASRHVQAWRDTIAAVTPGVQRFETALLHPTTFSPWQ